MQFVVVAVGERQDVPASRQAITVRKCRTTLGVRVCRNEVQHVWVAPTSADIKERIECLTYDLAARLPDVVNEWVAQRFPDAPRFTIRNGPGDGLVFPGVAA